jgi:hypothetical protein
MSTDGDGEGREDKGGRLSNDEEGDEGVFISF